MGKSALKATLKKIVITHDPVTAPEGGTIPTA